MVVEGLKINGQAMTTKELKILECECDFLLKPLKRAGMSQPRPSVSGVANAKGNGRKQPRAQKREARAIVDKGRVSS